MVESFDLFVGQDLPHTESGVCGGVVVVKLAGLVSTEPSYSHEPDNGGD